MTEAEIVRLAVAVQLSVGVPASLMASAAEKEAAGDLAAADRVLDAVQILAPDHLAAYERRARLYEKRGMIERAMEQWLELMERGKNTALHGKAMALIKLPAQAESAEKN